MSEADVYTQNQLADWWTAGITGDVACYHRGFLMVDRDPKQSQMLPHARLELDDLANLAWRFMQDGRVYLVQRRAANSTEYLAIKASQSGKKK